MPPNDSPHVLTQADKEKRFVAATSIAGAIVLTGLKLGVGLWTNSLGILSEAAHSGLDLVAAVVTYFAVRVSSKPPDPEHTYGHGKVENISALFETSLLLVTCAWIIWEASRRLFFKEVHVEVNAWSFAVILVSIAIDYSRSTALSRAAQKYQSQALEADALHFSTDIWSSSVVLFGLFGVLASKRWDIPWLVRADAVAALGVALIVIWVCYKLGKKSVDDLLDAVPAEFHEKVREAAQVPGVLEVRKTRMRRSGPEFFVDVTLTVAHGAAFETAHEIADRAEASIKSALANADVVVHVEPAVAAHEDIPTTAHVLASRFGMAAHNIRIYEENGERSLELHLEVSESLKVEEAHRQVTDFENALRQAVPSLSDIVSHIEPSGETAATVQAQNAGEAAIQEAIRDFLVKELPPVDARDVKVRLAAGEIAVSFRCALDPATEIRQAHALTDRLEKHLRTRVPNLGRVLIHVEPSS